MADKLHGRAIQPNTIPADRIVTGSLDSTKFDSTTKVVFDDTAFPKIRSLTYSTGNLNGYIDDLRVTKGIARYVQNFTPPTAAFLNK